MTKEEAKKILDPETSRDALLEYEGEERIEAVNEACRVAAAALDDQQTHAKLDRSQWDECEYCGEYGIVVAAFDGWRYCNRCGRPLTEEAWAELERRMNGNSEP